MNQVLLLFWFSFLRIVSPIDNLVLEDNKQIIYGDSQPIDNLNGIPFDFSVLLSIDTYNRSRQLKNTTIKLQERTLNQTEQETQFRQIIELKINQNLSEFSIEKIIQEVADQFLGSAYKAGLLDKSEKEKLFVSFQEFDCVLFVETVLAIARNITLNDNNYQTFTKHLQEQRYIDGSINGYCSRLHYFSDWINDNQRRGIVKNITAELGGIKFQKQLDFMSKNRKLYPKLETNEKNYQCIVERENKLNELDLNYIPNDRIKPIYSYLKPGDIISIATNIDGLDVTHTGLIYRTSQGNIGFIHASPAGQVTIARDLHNYAINVKNAVGIIVARPIDPRLKIQEIDDQ